MNTSYLKLLQENCKIIGKQLREQTEDDDMILKGKIKKFFRDNPNPQDSKVHALADKLGIAPDELENKIYEILSVYVQVGKHQDSPDSEFREDQLIKGRKVESEHSDCPRIQTEISKDHIAEIPDYYDRLEKMEKEGKEYWKNKKGREF